jgi:hypothetical protein
MNKRYLKIIESVNTFFQNSVLSTIFVFKSNIYQIGSIFEKTLAPILFPLVVIPDAIASLFTFYHFARAKNKNLGKTFDLIHVPIKTALVFTAVFAGLSLIFVQGLFLTAVGSSVVYHLSLSIFHAYHWFKSEKNLSIRALHKNHTINNLFSTSIGGIVVAGIILTMVVAPYLAATILTVAGITTASLLMLFTVFAIYRNFKNPDPHTPAPDLSETTERNLESSLTSTDSISAELSIVSRINPVNTNYYHREFRCEKKFNSQEGNKSFLLEEIGNKIESLDQQIKNSRTNFLGRSEESKRQDKIAFLSSLRDKINDNKSNLPPPSNKAFQSFFKDIGDVEDISLATEHYFQKYNQVNL